MSHSIGGRRPTFRGSTCPFMLSSLFHLYWWFRWGKAFHVLVHLENWYLIWLVSARYREKARRSDQWGNPPQRDWTTMQMAYHAALKVLPINGIYLFVLKCVIFALSKLIAWLFRHRKPIQPIWGPSSRAESLSQCILLLCTRFGSPDSLLECPSKLVATISCQFFIVFTGYFENTQLHCCEPGLKWENCTWQMFPTPTIVTEALSKITEEGKSQKGRSRYRNSITFKN